MKSTVLAILLTAMILAAGCFADIEEPQQTPTPPVTKRVYEDEPTSSPSPSVSYALLTPKPSAQEEYIDFSIFVIEVYSGQTAVAVNLGGDSVDLVRSASIEDISFENRNVNFITLDADRIAELEDKFAASIYLAAVMDSTATGEYSFSLDIVLNDGSQRRLTVREILEP